MACMLLDVSAVQAHFSPGTCFHAIGIRRSVRRP